MEDVVRISYNGYYGLFKYNDKAFSNENYFFADPSFFSVFDFKPVRGNVTNPFPDINSVVLTEKSAKRYFGNEEAIGKIITADDSVQFKVSGVIRDFPKNSSIQGDMIFPMNRMAKDIYANNKEGKNWIMTLFSLIIILFF